MSRTHFRDLAVIVKNEGVKAAVKYDLDVTRLRFDNLIMYGSLTLKLWQTHETGPIDLVEVKPGKFAYRRYH